jgi:hypothetical protein
MSSLVSSLSVSLAILRLLRTTCPSAALLHLGATVSVRMSVVTPVTGVVQSTRVLRSTAVLSSAADELSTTGVLSASGVLSATGVLNASVGETSRSATASHHSESITVVHLLNTTIIILRHT